MRKLTLTSLMLLLGFSTAAHASGSSRPVEIPVSQGEITANADLRDRNGQILSLRVSTPAIPAVDPRDPDRIATGVTPLDTAKSLCGDFPIDATEMNQRQSEARSTLTNIILQLQGMAPPRQLNADQRNALAQIPICEPFYGQLRTITQVLQEGAPLPEAHPAQPAFSMRVSGIAFFNDPQLGTGILAIRVNQQIAFFRLNRPIEVDMRTGRPINLQWVGATALQSGQGLGVTIAAIGRTWGGCATDYQMMLTNVDNSLVSRMNFRVDEGRCRREELLNDPSGLETDAGHE